MFRRMLFLLSFAALLTATAVPSFAWKFVSMADSRGSDNGVNTATLDKIISKVNAEGADLVIFQGDAVSGSKDDATVSSQMDTWLKCMSKLKCPWYYTPGNHEVQSPTVQENVLRTKVKQPLNGPSSDLEMVYSFNHKNAHFVVLNSDHYGKLHHVQLDWMAADLAKTTNPHVFVMAHDPAYPAGPHAGSSLDAHASERDNFWNKMTTGHVNMYFCGHEHLYQRSKHGSITQVINGSCGAPLYTSKGSISKYQYVVVDINGNSAKCQAKDDNGEMIDSWDYGIPTYSELCPATAPVPAEGTPVTPPMETKTN